MGYKLSNEKLNILKNIIIHIFVKLIKIGSKSGKR